MYRSYKYNYSQSKIQTKILILQLSNGIKVLCKIYIYILFKKKININSLKKYLHTNYPKSINSTYFELLVGLIIEKVIENRIPSIQSRENIRSHFTKYSKIALS